jgi:transcriptional regulator GlxA family with amidase domain
MRSHLNQITNWPERAHAAKYHAKELARSCGVSLRALQRFFASRKWDGPQTWLNDLRLGRARSLMREGCKSVKEAAHESGYSQPSQFSSKYKEFHGLPPSLDQKAFLSQVSLRDMKLPPPGTPASYPRPQAGA